MHEILFEVFNFLVSCCPQLMHFLILIHYFLVKVLYVILQVLDLIFILLHVITAASINPLLVSLIRIVTAVPLLLLSLAPAEHAAKLTISDGIIPLLLHLLIQLVKSRGLLEGAAILLCLGLSRGYL
jgi:hypothetical protein